MPELEAIGIDLCKERGLEQAHASCLRIYMAKWIREHKQELFKLSGGDDSWRGDAMPQPRGKSKGKRSRGAVAYMTLLVPLGTPG